MTGVVYKIEADPLLAIPTNPNSVVDILKKRHLEARTYDNVSIQVERELTSNELAEVYNLGYFLTKSKLTRSEK